LSFVLDERKDHFEGEVIISAETATTSASEHGWSSAAEQLLYVIHGTLHLVGYNDEKPEDAERMRAAEHRYLQRFGFEMRKDRCDGDDSTSADEFIMTNGG
jgi:probable rRNA maturation factor